MSARTIPVLEATIKATQSSKNWANVQLNQDQQKDAMAKAEALSATRAFWIDAICTPALDEARDSTLRSMGAIYGSAWQVFVVLSASSSAVFHQIRDTGRLDSSALFILEGDEWITRSWTYQEMVNSRALFFIAQDGEGVIISGVDFLSAVLTAADDYRSAHGIDSLTWSEQHPNLDSLECLIADYKIAQYAQRSAYQVMSAMHKRFSERVDDHFYAMVGAITTSALNIPGYESQSPSEYFMQTCEAKGDYSFVYNIAPRSQIHGRRWRPIEGKFPPVLPELLIFGDGQFGNLNATHIQFEKMCQLVPGNIGADGLKAVKAHLAMVHRNRPNAKNLSSPIDLAEAILELLRARGFSGCGEYLELENGFFFSQSKPARSNEISVAISIDVHWQGGGPGMLLRSNGTDINDFCDVGAFIGRVPKYGGSIRVG
ncbi:MAG: HET domain-containing protein [Planctomycetota bacterium]|nr:HET domain-containing protein [Planctomycetota bacterium]